MNPRDALGSVPEYSHRSSGNAPIPAARKADTPTAPPRHADHRVKRVVAGAGRHPRLFSIASGKVVDGGPPAFPVHASPPCRLGWTFHAALRDHPASVSRNVRSASHTRFRLRGRESIFRAAGITRVASSSCCCACGQAIGRPIRMPDASLSASVRPSGWAPEADLDPNADPPLARPDHHLEANVVTTDYSDWATNCPECKVTAVPVTPCNEPSDWQGS